MSAIIYQFPDRNQDVRQIARSLWPESFRNQMANRDAFYGLGKAREMRNDYFAKLGTKMTVNEFLAHNYPFTSAARKETQGRDYE